MMCPVTTRLLLLLQSLTYLKQRKKEHISTGVFSLLVRPHACTWVCVRVCVRVCGVCVRAHACLGVVFDLLHVIKSIVFQSRKITTFWTQTSISLSVFQKIQIFDFFDTDSYVMVNLWSIVKKSNKLPPNPDNLYMAHGGVGLKPSAGSVPTKQRAQSRFFLFSFNFFLIVYIIFSFALSLSRFFLFFVMLFTVCPPSSFVRIPLVRYVL